MTTAESPSLRLGQLLVSFGVCDQKVMEETLSFAVRTGLSIGKVAVESGLLSPDELEAVLRLQKILRQAKLSLNVAASAFRLVRSDELSLDEALGKAGVIEQIDSYSKLGVLLVDARLITPAQVDEAQRVGGAIGTAVGRVLCLMGLITPQILAEALDLQTLICRQRLESGN